jgi:hypothetical protein
MSLTCFYYDPTSPSGLRWGVDRYGGEHYTTRKVSVGDVAGCVSSAGYWVVNYDGKYFKAHRMIYELTHGPIPADMVVDHIDGKRCNNIVENLRLVSITVNLRNQHRRLNNTSGHTGVSFTTTKNGCGLWQASWRDLKGRARKRAFSSAKYGFMPAYLMAVKHRRQMIEQLNTEGAGYTDRHGI